eukprot:768436-Hanusia_phi.AAC.2
MLVVNSFIPEEYLEKVSGKCVKLPFSHPSRGLRASLCLVSSSSPYASLLHFPPRLPLFFYDSYFRFKMWQATTISRVFGISGRPAT